LSLDAEKMRDAIAAKATVLFAFLAGAWLVITLVLPAVSTFRLLFAIVFVTHSIWPVLVAWAIVPTVALILAVKRFRAQRFAASIAWLGVPAAAILIYFAGTTIGDRVHFWIEKSSYDRVLADAHAGKCEAGDHKPWGVAIDAIDCHDPITVVFIWDGFLSAWNGVIYDAADEIAKLPEDRSEGWRSREIGKLLGCSGATYAFGAHYYRAGGDYAC
jgi:hypothetical protein